MINYQSNFIIFGLLAGLGAILGDLVKSFFKRRLGIKSGQSWPIFDQLDFIAGFLFFTYYFSTPSINIIITTCLITLILHPLTNLISYWLGFKKVWWWVFMLLLGRQKYHKNSRREQIYGQNRISSSLISELIIFYSFR